MDPPQKKTCSKNRNWKKRTVSQYPHNGLYTNILKSPQFTLRDSGRASPYVVRNVLVSQQGGINSIWFGVKLGWKRSWIEFTRWHGDCSRRITKSQILTNLPIKISTIPHRPMLHVAALQVPSWGGQNDINKFQLRDTRQTSFGYWARLAFSALQKCPAAVAGNPAPRLFCFVPENAGVRSVGNTISSVVGCNLGIA